MQSSGKAAPALTGKKVLVTGGSGFIGSHLVERLLREGAEVAVVSRSRGKLDALDAGLPFRFTACDLHDAGQTQAAFSGFEPEIVFHLAGHPDSRETFEQADAVIRSNVLCTLNVLEAFKNCCGKVLVYGDSCKVYGECEVPYREHMPSKPRSSYAIAKAAGWELCNLYRTVHGVSTVSVRPTMVHGARQPFNLVTYVVNCVLAGKEAVVLDGGDQTRDLLAVDDAVEAYVRTAQRGADLAGRVINVGGGCERSIADLARMVLEILDSKIPVVCAPERMRATEMQRSYCDNAEARAMLDWVPVLSLHAGLEKTVAALLKQQGEGNAETPAMARAVSAA